jgi:hypothetical protein
VSRRRVALASATALALSPLAGCGAGLQNTAGEQYAPADGVLVDIEDVRANNVFVVGDESGQGAVVTTLVNRGDQPDELLSVTLPGGGQATIQGDTAIPPGGALRVGADGDAQVLLDGLEAMPGQSIQLYLTLQQAGDAMITTVVLPAENEYADQLSGGVVTS